MNVCGLTSNTRSPARLASLIDACDSRGYLARPPARSSNRSISMKPKLCRVDSYSGPGFPSPTINLITAAHKLRAHNRGSKISLPLLLFGLALLYDFGLGGCGRYFVFCRRLRPFLQHSRRPHARDDLSRIGQHLYLFSVVDQIADQHVISDHQRRDVNLQSLRNVARKTFDLDLTKVKVQNAALLLHTGGFADRLYRNLNLSRGGHRQPHQIGM